MSYHEQLSCVVVSFQEQPSYLWLWVTKKTKQNKTTQVYVVSYQEQPNYLWLWVTKNNPVVCCCELPRTIQLYAVVSYQEQANILWSSGNKNNPVVWLGATCCSYLTIRYFDSMSMMAIGCVDIVSEFLVMWRKLSLYRRVAIYIFDVTQLHCFQLLVPIAIPIAVSNVPVCKRPMYTCQITRP